MIGFCFTRRQLLQSFALRLVLTVFVNTLFIGTASAEALRAESLGLEFSDSGEATTFTGVSIYLRGVERVADGSNVGNPNYWSFEISSDYKKQSHLKVGLTRFGTFAGGKNDLSIYDTRDPKLGKKWTFGFASTTTGTLSTPTTEVARFYSSLESNNRTIFRAICQILNNKGFMTAAVTRMKQSYKSGRYRQFWASPARLDQLSAVGMLCAQGIAIVDPKIDLRKSSLTVDGVVYDSAGGISQQKLGSAGSSPAKRVTKTPLKPETSVQKVSSPCENTETLRRYIQPLLSKYGFYKGAIDGLYGPGTASALQSLYAYAGLDFDPATSCLDANEVFALTAGLASKSVSGSNGVEKLKSERNELTARVKKLDDEVRKLTLEKSRLSDELQAVRSQTEKPVNGRVNDLSIGDWKGRATQDGYSLTAPTAGSGESSAKLGLSCTNAGPVIWWQFESPDLDIQDAKVLIINNVGDSELSTWTVYPSEDRAVLFMDNPKLLTTLLGKFSSSLTLTLQMVGTQQFNIFSVKGLADAQQELSCIQGEF